jgi:hypothetical protein
MSELINLPDRSENFRRGLFTNVSILALMSMAWASSGGSATAADEDQPTVWIELGGQFEQVNTAQQPLLPPFVDQTPPADRIPLIDGQKAPRYGVGGEGAITFEPNGTNWVFSATARYGRSNGTRHPHQQTPIPYVKRYLGTQLYAQPADELYGDAQSQFGESHLTIDFKAGKDVGLGLFGRGAQSVISAGIRYAQFSSSADVSLHARPYYKMGEKHAKYPFYKTYGFVRHTYSATFQAKRNTHAIGPSVSWDGSLPVMGNSSDATLNVDWGLNAAILFGRQRAHVKHQTYGYHFTHVSRLGGYLTGSYLRPAVDVSRARSVTIPNLGASAGLTLKFVNAEVSLGYRADFFFGATDNGIDTAHSTNVGFYGPFATISIGLGG